MKINGLQATEPIVYQDEHVDLKIVLRPALITDGLRFSIWQLEASQHQNGDDTIARYARMSVHPTCCAAIDTEQSHLIIDGVSVALPPSWDVWSHLPTVPIEILNRWYGEARALNPQWEVQEASEKKGSAMTSTGGLPISTSHRAKKGRRNNTRT